MWVSEEALKIIVGEALKELTPKRVVHDDRLLDVFEAVRAAQASLAEILPVSDDDDFGVVEVYEYDCGKPCTENGCPGHETDIPMSIEFLGATFHVDGAERGDFPTGASKEHVRIVGEAVALMGQRLNDRAPARWRAKHERVTEILFATVGRLKKLVMYADHPDAHEAIRIWNRGEPEGETDWLNPPAKVDELLKGLP